MKIIRLRSIPNQDVSFSADGHSFDLRIHYFRDLLYVNVAVDGSVIANGIRCVPGQWIVQSGLVPNGVGNIMIETNSGKYPDYKEFDSDVSRLVYYDPNEVQVM